MAEYAVTVLEFFGDTPDSYGTVPYPFSAMVSDEGLGRDPFAPDAILIAEDSFYHWFWFNRALNADSQAMLAGFYFT